MALVIRFEGGAPDRGGRNVGKPWVVYESQRTSFGSTESEVSAHKTKKAAVSAARRRASSGERIVAQKELGGQEVIREGQGGGGSRMLDGLDVL